MTQPRGFIALMSAIVIATILLIVVVGGGLLGFFTRADILASELKARSAGLVDSCVDTIQVRLGSDSTYAGPETVSIGSDQCQIAAGTTVGSYRRFKVSAGYQRSYTYALVTVDPSTSAVVSWQEVAN